MPRGVKQIGRVAGVTVRRLPELKRLMAETGCGALLRRAVEGAKKESSRFFWVSSADLLVVVDLDERGRRLLAVDVYRRIAEYRDFEEG